MIIIAIFNAVLLPSGGTNARDSTHVSGISCILTFFQGQVCLTSLPLSKTVTGSKKWIFFFLKKVK